MDAFLDKTGSPSNGSWINRALAFKSLQYRRDTDVLQHGSFFCELWAGGHFPRDHRSWNIRALGKPSFSCGRSHVGASADPVMVTLINALKDRGLKSGRLSLLAGK